MTAHSLPGGRPLDPDRPAAEPAQPTPDPGLDATGGPASGPVADGPAGAPREEPPLGLRAQLGATRAAGLGFIRAHIDLAKAEIDEIKGEVGRAAALGGVAIASLILLSLLLAIGGMLFTGEWLFGSIGWGLLLGAELLIAIAITAVLVALRIPGLAWDGILALVIGVVVALVLGFDLPNQLFRWAGEAMGLGIDPAVRPLVMGVATVGILGALIGLLLGGRSGGAAGALAGLIGGLIAGALLGAFLAITFGLRVGAALGVAAFLLVWPVLEGLRTQRQGIDTEALKARFYPATTIDTTKESIEWAKARVPRGRQS